MLLVRFAVWLLTHTVYRVEAVGEGHVPPRGSALLVCNHLSYIDGLFVAACVRRTVRFVVHKPHHRYVILNWLLRRLHAISSAPGREAESIARAREELRQGHIVCLFAEGTISRTGNLLPFNRSFQSIAAGLDVPVIPVYFDQVWGSVFSF